MSLTSELRRTDSWVNRFFKDRFPKITSFVREEAGPDVQAMAIRVPLTCGNPSLIGTAFDYRLRIRFGTDFSASEVLKCGIFRMMDAGDSGLGKLGQVWGGAMLELLSEPPEGNEDKLARVSIILAWLDAGYRSGGRWSPGMRKVAKNILISREATWGRCAPVVDKSMAGELAMLMCLAEIRLPAANATCGPTFDGSRYVGGADADIVIGGCLYDVKTTVKPREKLPESIRQLIGYALLDWNDKCGLEQAGFYFSRQGEWKSWPIQELIVRGTGDSKETLSELRNDFRSLAETHWPRRRLGVAGSSRTM